MKNIFSLIFCFVIIVVNSFAKNGYTLEAKIKNNSDSVLYLAHYYAKPQRVYKIDSAFASAEGEFKFKADSLANGGIYLLITKKNASVLEFLLQAADNFTIAFDRNEPVKTAVFTGSKENTDFYEYQKYLVNIQGQYQQITTELAAAKTAKDSTKANAKSLKLGDEIKAYRKTFVQKNPQSLAASLFNSMEDPEIPEALTLADKKRGKKALKANESTAFAFYKTHYWDKFDFAQDAVMNTPIYDKKLEDYFKMVLSVPDSFNKEADFLLNKSRSAKEIFKYTLNYLSYYAENSRVMGMDESFVYLVENYYMKGDAKAWQADSVLVKYTERAAAIAPNMLGQKARDIRIPDMDGNITSFTEFCKKQAYTLLVFYDPGCGHCQKEIPAADSVVEVLRKEKIDIKIFGIKNANEEVDKWKEFITNKKLNPDFWLHLHDPSHVGGYIKNYDVRTNPVLYLVNQNGVIVGKRIDHSNLAGLIKNIEKLKKTKAEQ